MSKDIAEIINRMRLEVVRTEHGKLALVDPCHLTALCDEIERQNDQALADKFAGFAMQVFLNQVLIGDPDNALDITVAKIAYKM